MAPHVVGDLDPHLPRHTFTPLNLDLRIISQFLACLFLLDHATNVFVAPDQVIYTVDPYFLLNR